MKLKQILILFSLIIICYSCNRKNPPSVNEYNAIMQGEPVQNLPDSIMSIYQDKANNHWFGSRGKGVFKYNGKHLLQYNKKHGLVDNDIWGIQEDKSGNIYFDTQKGVSKFDGKSFITLPTDITSDNTWKLGTDDLWFKGNWNVNGTYRYDGKTLHFLKFPANKLADEMLENFPNVTWSPYGIYTIYTDKKGHIWFGTSNVGLYRFDGKNISYMYEEHLTNTMSGGSFGIRSIFEDRLGKFWICNTQYRYNIAGDSAANGQYFLTYSKEKGIPEARSSNGDLLYFLSITEDNDNNLWMLTYNDGIWKYDGNKLTNYPISKGKENIKSFTIYRDNQGKLWVGTHEDGAYTFNGKSFEKFKP